ncbi:MAG: DUF167 domain-containing protein [Candidatus Omnitrophica bacterium]|nr:DUF167 domain-containing protein [Candidatus Omnitrophota bacterium]
MRLEIKVIPKSSREEIVEKNGIIKVYVKVPPDKGKANKAVIELIAEEYNVKKGEVEIIKGQGCRNKVVEIKQRSKVGTRRKK